MVKIGVHLRKLSQNYNWGTAFFGPLCRLSSSAFQSIHRAIVNYDSTMYALMLSVIDLTAGVDIIFQLLLSPAFLFRSWYELLEISSLSMCNPFPLIASLNSNMAICHVANFGACECILVKIYNNCPLFT